MKTTFLILALCAGNVCAATLFNADFNAADGGFTVSSSANMPPANTWKWTAGIWSADGEGTLGAPSFASLTSPLISVPATGNVTLSFDHRYNFELDTVRWDGGQVQISINGAAFSALTGFTANGHINTVEGNNVLTGQQAYLGASAGYAGPSYITSAADLGTLRKR